MILWVFLVKTIETSRTFDKELKKFGLTAPLIDVLSHLINNKSLPVQYRDHQLKGELKRFRECHIRPDLLLMYEKYDDKIVLVRLNSHSELFK